MKKVCPICHKEFEETRQGKKYCSNACARIAGQYLYKKTCNKCGKETFINMKVSKTCSCGGTVTYTKSSESEMLEKGRELYIKREFITLYNREHGSNILKSIRLVDLNVAKEYLKAHENKTIKQQDNDTNTSEVNTDVIDRLDRIEKQLEVITNLLTSETKHDILNERDTKLSIISKLLNV